MKALIIAFAALLLFSAGCFLLEGSLRRGNSKVLLIKDNPGYVDKDDKDAPRGYLGALPYHKGDTIKTIGFYSGGIESSYFLILADKKEVYISRSDVLTPDDQLYNRLGSKFKLKLSEDHAAWNRTLVYVKNRSTAPPEIANESLIKSKSTTDTTEVNYIITRVVQGTQVEYEIISKSLMKDFNPSTEASQLAFYMTTGKMYEYEN